MFIQDSDALLNQLMQDYGNELKRIAYLYVNDHAECEDIVQEVFIACYQGLSTFRQESTYKTWLIRITINKCKDHKKRWSIKNMIYKPAIYPSKTNQSSEAYVIQWEHTNEIVEQLANLPGKYKEVLILYYYQDMTMKEIGEVLNVGINTVKSRLLRGKEVLKSKLERSITLE
ncbi:sigma-70 family RNA polymerase sigma factor [Sporosarcina sp. FSL K6-2383]|uniref:sigma-70 family RNA polymerase sigma factor n=1 Tax=Sporosarcina sp. FSL K6-2383 TaxID=2921556 RepID=UPI003159CAF4